jgi:F-type H+-transporting ATPase subunit delta
MSVRTANWSTSSPPNSEQGERATMAELTTLARPYAKAAFTHARAAGTLDAWARALGTAAAVTTDERAAQLLGSPAFTATRKADALIEVCGEDLPADARNFVRVLAENRRLPLLPQIHALFLALKTQQEKAVELQVNSAYEITPEQAERLARVMGEKLQRNVRVSTAVDASLIGGVVIRTEDLVIDGSVRGRLAKLSEAMNS